MNVHSDDCKWLETALPLAIRERAPSLFVPSDRSVSVLLPPGHNLAVQIATTTTTR